MPRKKRVEVPDAGADAGGGTAVADPPEESKGENGRNAGAPVREIEALDVRAIPLDLLIPSPHNRRRTPSEKELKDLADSLKAMGQLQPGVCRPHPDAAMRADGRFEILAGERRWRAAALAGMAAVHMSVRNLDDREAVIVTATENNQREDLTPMEEAGILGELLGVGLSIEEAADKLGRGLKWAARRRSLENLSESWKALVGGKRPKGFNDEHSEILQGWPAVRLEKISRLPAATQERLLADLGRHGLNEIASERDLQNHLDDFMRNLSAAPWPKDDAKLVPAAGACDACPKRSSCQPELFDAPGRGKGKAGQDQCLDPVCWAAKQRAFVTLKIDETKKESGAAPIRIRTGHYSYNEEKANPLLKDAVPDWQVNKCKPDVKGAKPAVIVDGPNAGNTIYVAPASSRSESGGKKSSPKSKTMKEKEAGLEKRRQKRADELFMADIETAAGKKGETEFNAIAKRTPLASIVAYLIAFGCKGVPRFDFTTRKEVKPAKEFARLAAQDLKSTEMRDDLTRTMLTEIKDKHSHWDVGGNWVRMAIYCEILQMDSDEYMQKAIGEIAEPRSWAVQRLEEKNAKKKTPAGKAAKGKKTAKKAAKKSAKSGKRAAADPENDDSGDDSDEGEE